MDRFSGKALFDGLTICTVCMILMIVPSYVDLWQHDINSNNNDYQLLVRAGPPTIQRRDLLQVSNSQVGPRQRGLGYPRPPDPSNTAASYVRQPADETNNESRRLQEQQQQQQQQQQVALANSEQKIPLKAQEADEPDEELPNVPTGGASGPSGANNKPFWDKYGVSLPRILKGFGFGGGKLG